MQVRLNFQLSKTFFVLAGSIIIFGLTSFLYLKQRDASPLPSRLQDKVSFKVAYPRHEKTSFNQDSFKYEDKQAALSFSTSYEGANIAFTEQPVPPALGSSTEAYYPALGIHPYAQFKTDLGTVALTKFWQSGSLKPFGQTAIMAVEDTLITARSDKELTNQQWKELFESLKITR